MRRCPNDTCPRRLEGAPPAEYAVDVSRCPACETPLVGVSARGAAGRLWARLGVTLAAVVVLVLMRRWDLTPYIVGPDKFAGGGGWLSVDGVGLRPFAFAFVVVELFALAVPSWRQLRFEPAGRRRLTRASLVLGAVFMVVEASSALARLGMERFPLGGYEPPLATLAALLCCGSFVLLLLTRVVDRRGLGNGFSVVLGASIALTLFDDWFTWLKGSASPAVWLVIALPSLAFVVVFARLQRAPEARFALPFPASGVVPLSALMLLEPLVLLAFTTFWPSLPRAAGWTSISPFMQFPALTALVVINLSLLFGWLFNRPRNVSGVWQRYLPEADDARSGSRWREALVPAIGGATAFLFVAGAGAFSVEVDVPMYLTTRLLLVVGPLTCTAVLFDLFREWQMRQQRGELARVCSLQRVYEVAPVIERLRGAGIDAVARGYAYRALLHFFGPYVSIDVLVPADRLDEAKACLQ